ncbi:MAG TPA: site-2 protease family protein [Vitreimonas sp.]|nr:site-2 protease family protein [Vitreimonas sp.]
MIDLLFSNPLAFFVLFPGLLLSIALHEFAHAWMADRLGDPTPRYQGRVTLNPLAHLDPLGTMAMLFTRFGWGKPVEFDPYNLKNPPRDTAIIALAGPALNLLIAASISLALHFITIPSLWLIVALIQIMQINVVLAIFNLVPVYPLDGSKILFALLPKRTAFEYDEFMRHYGMFVLLLLLFPWGNQASPVSLLISPVIDMVMNILLGGF